VSRAESPDTIVAVSSAPGAAERVIVRMSGPESVSLAAQVFRPDDGPPIDALPAWSVSRGVLRVSVFSAPVPALCYLMRAPRSYTREDVVEFHTVGAPAVASAVVGELTAREVRLARAGEFTERAYLSGRIDLSQAEAVLKLIHATDDAERRLALGELTGELSVRIERLAGRLVDLLARVELALDFSEDDIPVIGAAELTGELAAASAEVDELLRSGSGRAVFSEEPRIALIGRTNVGKSSLFNRLLSRDEAIVTDVHGTTRDVLEGELELAGVTVLLVDTAGETAPPGDRDASLSPLPPAGGEAGLPAFLTPLPPRGGEGQGEGGSPAGGARFERSADSSADALDPDDIALARARAELDRADLVLLVVDASEPLTAIDMTLLDRLASSSSPLGEERGREPSSSPLPPAGGEGEGEGGNVPDGTDARDHRGASTLIVLNKTDLAVNAETERVVRRRGIVAAVSCLTGAGLDDLRRELAQALTVRGLERTGLRFLFNLRQLDALRSAGEALARAAGATHRDIGLEFTAADIRAALGHLREMTHPFEEEEVLDHIFSRFCIGK